MRFLLGLALAASAAAAAVGVGALTIEGAWAATALGALIFLAGGLSWSAVILVFFVTSSALSRLRSAGGRSLDDMVARSERRDAVQVAANGALPALFSLLQLVHPSSLYAAGFAGAIAAAAADTWATEVGALSRSPPVLLTTGKRIPPGTSGGVTILGSAGAALGAAVVGLVASFLMPPLGAGPILVAGLLGSFTDSFLGATVQERRTCPICMTRTEQVRHRICGAETERTGGIPHVDNDVVNLLACCAGSVAAAALVHAPSVA